jgi:hypothetical protein
MSAMFKQDTNSMFNRRQMEAWNLDDDIMKDKAKNNNSINPVFMDESLNLADLGVSEWDKILHQITGVSESSTSKPSAEVIDLGPDTDNEIMAETNEIELIHQKKVELIHQKIVPETERKIVSPIDFSSIFNVHNQTALSRTAQPKPTVPR